jgi:predicted dehydrogenase
MAATIKVGIVGFGISAKVFHAPFVTTVPGYELVAVMERHNRASAEIYPWVKVVRTFEELVEDPGIDLIVVTTPNETHFPYARAALQHGKHVVLEKPFTITTVEARTLVELSHKSKAVLSVYQNRRYVADFFTIREIFSKNLLGHVHEFEAHYNRYRPEAKPNAWREEPKPGSGILYDLGSHIIDQALYFFGMPKRMIADVRKQRPHARIDDYFDLRLDYGDRRVILKSGMLVREPGPRYSIHGKLGSFQKYGEDPQEVLLRKGILPTAPDWGMESEEIYGLLHTLNDGQLIKEKYPSLPGNYGSLYLDLYNTIRRGEPLKVKPEHGYNTIRLIELATESNEKKCRVECTDLIEIEYP